MVFSKKKKSKDGDQKMKRSSSLPPNFVLKSNMRVSTLDESLHSTYYRHAKSERDVNPITSREPTIDFGKVYIREYERVAGDNPSCSSGVPVSIGWRYADEPIVLPLEDYETSRPDRRNPTQMLLPRSVRESMLKKEWGVPQSQIASAVRENIKVKNQRRRTVTNMSAKNEKLELAMENAGKKFKNSFKFRRSPSNAQSDEVSLDSQ